MSKHLVLGLAAVGFAACQASMPALPRTPGRMPQEVFDRFELDEPAEAPMLETIHVMGESEAADAEGVDAPSAALELDDVLLSVDQHFPLILAAEEEIAIAEGELLAARGGFDLKLKGRGTSEFEGFYEADRADFSVEQPTTLWGATFSGGYRLGRGDFAVYDGKQKTDEGGEFRVGVTVPLLQGRAIDPRRVATWQARLARERADPIVDQKRLEVSRKAADVYWKWVAAGRVREIALRVLALAEARVSQLELAVEKGLFAPIFLTENQRLIVDRRQSLLKAERGLQKAAIELSLYWRDADGRPVPPPDSALPYDFPAPRSVEDVLFAADEGLALEHRPEVLSANLELEGMRLDVDLLENTTLPELSLGVMASQDVGPTVNDPDDKGPFEMGTFISLQVPLQRRKAKGKLRATSAKLEKRLREVEFLQDRIVQEVRDARSALTQAWLRIGEARENVRLADELAVAERVMLEKGQSDLLRVNLRELQEAVAAAALVSVLEEYFRSLNTYRAVLGVPYGPRSR